MSVRGPFYMMVSIFAITVQSVTVLAAPPPNVVVILADDLGYADVGYQGCKDIPTPNIDSLAAGGVRFTSGYVTWPACSPSRAAMITGQDSHRFGYYNNPNPVLAANQGLPPGIQTVPKALQQLGYVTSGIGKWHLGTTPDRHPNVMGFTEWYGFLGGAHDYFPWEHYNRKLPSRPWPEWFVNETLPIVRQNQEVPETRYLTDAFSDEAVTFIRGNHEKPFFLYLAYNAPHSPYEAPASEEARMALDGVTPPKGVSPKSRRTYDAMVSKLDQGIGRVMAALKEAGLEERTLVFFLSDNGGGKNPAYPSSNHPLRGYKGSLYEGGIRVPFIASWKGQIKPGANYDHPVSSLDIGATALALGGGAPAGMPLDGVNLMPYLQGQTNGVPHERLFWNRMESGAIREGRYKLLTGEKKRPELYDLATDLGETRNIARENPALVKRLHAAWKQWKSSLQPPAWTDVPEIEWTKPQYQPPLRPEEKR